MNCAPRQRSTALQGGSAAGIKRSARTAVLAVSETQQGCLLSSCNSANPTHFWEAFLETDLDFLPRLTNVAALQGKAPIQRDPQPLRRSHIKKSAARRSRDECITTEVSYVSARFKSSYEGFPRAVLGNKSRWIRITLNHADREAPLCQGRNRYKIGRRTTGNQSSFRFVSKPTSDLLTPKRQ